MFYLYFEKYWFKISRREPEVKIEENVITIKPDVNKIAKFLNKPSL